MRTPLVTTIAGVYYHCKNVKSGDYVGYLRPENNEKDPNAIAVYIDSNIKVGYIPRTETDIVRRWAKKLSAVKCKISINIIEELNYYKGEVVLLDETPFPHSEIYEHKKALVCVTDSDYALTVYSYLVGTYGINVVSELTKDTEYVICVDELPAYIIEKQSAPDYNFKALRLSEFIIDATPESERDSILWDKEAACVRGDGTPFAGLINATLCEKGAKIVPRVRKKTTTILVKWPGRTSDSEIEKAFELGIPVIPTYNIVSPISSDPDNFPPKGAPVVKSDNKNKVRNKQADKANEQAALILAFSFLAAIILFFLLKK